MFVCLVNRKIVPDLSANFAKAELFKFDFSGMVSSFPLIIFAYMYQINVPSIYLELEKRHYTTMSKVVGGGSIIAVFMYIVIGMFGYVTFVDDP